MKLTKDEKQSLINAKDETAWYQKCDEIKARRNGIYPNYLSREILQIYQNKFPVDKYKECFSKYDPDKIILVSHTNVAVGQILDAIMKLKEVKEKGYRRKFFDDRICTIHHYCKSKLMGSKGLFSNEDFQLHDFDHHPLEG